MPEIVGSDDMLGFIMDQDINADVDKLAGHLEMLDHLIDVTMPSGPKSSWASAINSKDGSAKKTQSTGSHLVISSVGCPRFAAP